MMDEEVLNVALVWQQTGPWVRRWTVPGNESFGEGSAEKIQCICFRKAPAVLIHIENYCELHFFLSIIIFHLKSILKWYNCSSEDQMVFLKSLLELHAENLTPCLEKSGNDQCSLKKRTVNSLIVS